MVLLVAVFIFLIMRHEKPAKLEIPFTTLGWESSVEDMEAENGTLYVTTASSGGTTYQYIKEYLGQNGYLKFHFNDAGTLVGIAWSTEAKSAQEMEALYNEIATSLTKEYGEGRTTSSGLNHAWELSDGTSIHLNTGFGGSDYSLQYFYINPIAL